MIAKQPIPQIPDLRDSGFVSGWLNRAARELGQDTGPDATDMAIQGNLKFTKNSAGPFTSSNYLKNPKANWRSDTQGSITAWIMIDAMGVVHTILASADEGGAVKYFRFEVGPDDLLDVWHNGTAELNHISATTTPLVVGQWHHVALVSTGSDYLMYVDAIPQSLTVDAGSNDGAWLDVVTLRDNVTLGYLDFGGGANQPHNGKLDDVRYYNRALSQSDITKIVLAGIPDPDLVAIWLPCKPTPEDYSRYRHGLSVVGDLSFARRGAGPFTTANYLRQEKAADSRFDNFRGNDLSGSLGLWVRHDTLDASNQYYFSSSDEAATTRRFIFGIDATTDQLMVIQRDGGTQNLIRSTKTLTAGQWHNVWLTSNGFVYKFYIDGVLETTNIVEGGADNGNWLGDTTLRDNVTLGITRHTSTNSPMQGELSEVRLYRAEKNADFIRRYYNRTRVFP